MAHYAPAGAAPESGLDSVDSVAHNAVSVTMTATETRGYLRLRRRGVPGSIPGGAIFAQQQGDEMESDEREQRLPAWARELLSSLRLRLKSATEPLAREVAKLRPENERLKRRSEMMTELLECAARGGHMTAKQIMDVIAPYCDDEYATLDSVLSARRPEEESGVNLGEGL